MGLTRTLNLGERLGHRPGPASVIGIELRIQPMPGQAQEEVFMEGLDIRLPDFYQNQGPGLAWSVTLHTTNGDVTLDTNQNYGGLIR